MSGVKVFQNVGAVRPGRSVFDLSYEKKFACDMGQLIPIMCDEVVPGDIFEIGNQALIRFQPLVSPVLHEINMTVHYYFVPYRKLWDDWENFITGGADGQFTDAIPTWEPVDGVENVMGSLWDFLGFPVGVDPDGAYPMSFPRDAYNWIFNEYYRDETLTPEVLLTSAIIQNRAWEKDYFTSALPWQQRGIAPALPISGTTSAVWAASSFPNVLLATGLYVTNTAGDERIGANNANAAANVLGTFNDNTVDLTAATPLDLADLRIAMQIQRWMERNARAGARYTEFLQSHFGQSPRDDRLQRPEYIGGTKAPVIVSEVLQTSETDTTPQGNLAGHGLCVSNQYAGKYRVEEFGLIMGIMSVMPKPCYSQGINRQWLRRTKYDFYFPEFANLSEQNIIQAELYATNVSAENNTPFGFQGQYDEMRTKSSMICSQFRTTFNYWHLAREFGSAPELNDAFIKCVPRKDIFAVPAEPGLLVQFGNVIKAIRPMPAIANPGLIDHV